MPIQTRDETRQPDGDLGTLQASLVGCTRCPLHSQGRTQVVFGVGNPEADVLLIGEAPGFDEDAQGIPFVGRAGQLLTKIIEGGMKMSREDVYIANVIKCRPPKNRDPLPVEVATCRPFVLQQIDYIQPKVIITLGRVATQALLDTTASITRIRGTWQSLEQWPVMPTFHPAYLLRNPAGKRDVWEDIQKVNRFLSDGIL
ncbi:MAG: uracil-DNA glycosylase [Myxococcales bacterium]|nr:uracil-DNA glycosylase [Myxococcales bacterium]